jgi:outer membrane protein
MKIKRNMKNTFIIQLTFLISLILFFQEGKAQQMALPANLSKLVEQSFLKFPRVDEMNDQVKMNEVKVELGKAAYWPIANGDISYRRMYPTDPISISTGPDQTREIHIMPANNYNAGISLIQPLFDFKTPANISKSKSELTTSIDNLEGFKLQLAYQVAQLYYGIIFLDKSILVQHEQLDLIKTNIGQIEAKIKNGDALEYDRISMQVRYTNMENQFTDLQNQRNKQYNLLNMLSGNSGTEYVSDTIINDNWVNLATDSIFSIANRNNFDLKTANDKIESAKWGIITNDRLQWPTLNFLAGSGFKNGLLPDINQTRFNYYVGAGVTIPIFSGSRPEIQKKMAMINLDASNHAMESQRITLNKDILNVLDDLKKDQTKLSGSDALIAQATMALQLAKDRYKNGVITTLELLTAQTNYQDALLSRLQYEYNLLLTKLEMNRLAGKRWW